MVSQEQCHPPCTLLTIFFISAALKARQVVVWTLEKMTPMMPDVYWAIGVLLLRFSISQMDVPTRQAYTMAVVRPDERSAAAGVTAVARSVGASISPMLATVLVGSVGLMSVPFFLAGGLKIVYDLLLYRAFANNEDRNK